MRETEFSLKCNKTSQKIILGRCCCWRPGLAENDRHHECEQLPARHLFPWSSRFRRIYRSCRASVLSGVKAIGAVLTLAQWQAQLIIPVAVKNRYSVNPHKGSDFTRLFSHCGLFLFAKSDNVTPRFYF